VAVNLSPYWYTFGLLWLMMALAFGIRHGHRAKYTLHGNPGYYIGAVIFPLGAYFAAGFHHGLAANISACFGIVGGILAGVSSFEKVSDGSYQSEIPHD